jgi:hypothetical protein
MDPPCFDGKEGVDGSRPSEGFVRTPRSEFAGLLHSLRRRDKSCARFNSGPNLPRAVT